MFKVVEICEELDYTELYKTYMRMWRKVNPVTVRNVKSADAGFIVALTGDIMAMTGLPKTFAAFMTDVDEGGKISGLF